ncbi:MAG: V4R domain-containing protein [Candidatus Methanomethylicia archaeon]
MEFRYVKDLPVVYVRPGRRLAEVVVEARDVIGILASLSGIMSENRINIVYLLCSTDALKARFIFFIDLTESRIGLDGLKDIIRQQPYTISVDVWNPPVDGVVYDALCFPTMVHGFQSFIMRYDTLSSIIEEFRRRIGDGAVAIFYHLGYYSGYAYAEYVKKQLETLNLPLRDVVRVAFDLDRSFGDFNSELVMLDVDGGRAIVRVYDSCEATPIRGRMKMPSCQYVRGKIAGTLSSLLGREVIAVERKCIATGDNYCEFHIEPRKQ